MTIQHQPCPRCHIRRTVRLHGLNHCFNCQYQWAQRVYTPSFPFTQRELERLNIYRRAVRAGIYSDWPVFA
jgi:ribosomal protein L37AE/L43A